MSRRKADMLQSQAKKWTRRGIASYGVSPSARFAHQHFELTFIPFADQNFRIPASVTEDLGRVDEGIQFPDGDTFPP